MRWVSLNLIKNLVSVMNCKFFCTIFSIFLTVLLFGQNVGMNDTERGVDPLENMLKDPYYSGRTIYHPYREEPLENENELPYPIDSPVGPVYRIVFDPVSRIKFYPQAQLIVPVVKIEVKVGSSFKQGDLLLQLDPGKFEAFYLKAKSNLEKAAEELRAKTRLYEDGNGSNFDYIAAKSNYVTAEAEVVLAEKNLEAVTFIAPYNGKVASISIEEHELPLENKEMMEVINDRHLIGKVLLPSTMVRQVKIGDPLEITVDETKTKIQAKISRIATVIDPSSSTFKIEVDLDNANGELIVGMTGSVKIN
jgi:hypothetical protein